MTPEDAEGVLGLVITLSLLGGLAGVGVYVWYSLALAALFTKLGVDSWRAWVPVLNEMEILGRGGVPAWSVVYYFIPVVNLYGLYLKATAVHRIDLELGRGAGTTVLGVLLPPVWASILGWGPTPAVAGVYDKRVESMLGSGAAPAPSVPSGPLAAPVAPSAPFSQVASDPSGYALPVARPVAPPPAAPFAPPVAPQEPAPVVAPAPDAAADAAPGPTTAPAGVIHNPWASPRPVVSQPPVIAPPVGGQRETAPPAAETAPPAAAEPAAASAAPASVASVLGAPDDDDDDELDRTVVVDRRPVVPWRLRTDDGFEVALTAAEVVLGRNPATTGIDIQTVAIPDTTRTLSKTHARLDLADGAWTITDLGSTNGVLVTGADGAEELIPVGEAIPVRSRFVLGEVGMALSFEHTS
jgi:hypothetical protein